MNTEAGTKPTVLVCQKGARHRYAIPRMLEEEGMLAALYTDSTVFSGAGQLASGLARMGMRHQRMDALRLRIPAGIPKSKIHSSDRPLYSAMTRSAISQDLSDTFIRWGLQGARALYNMYGENLGFVDWARQQGCRIIVDVFVHPGFLRTVAEESRIFMEDKSDDRNAIELHKAHSRETFEMADVLLCPSEWVASGVREMFPMCAHKIRIVPYGSSLEIDRKINSNPSVGRVLFAGREALRKGLHYLAEAAGLIRAEGGAIDVRVAGVKSSELDWMEHREQLECLGTLPLDAMRDEFRQADVFVLPSLTEGQAGVLLEAMACGCPVIATRESGVDFQPGSGIIVPARNAGALADAIRSVVDNRQARNQLAEGALRQARDFSMDAWKRRLIAVIEESLTLDREECA